MPKYGESSEVGLLSCVALLTAALSLQANGCKRVQWGLDENELWLAIVLEPSNKNHQTFNSKCDGSVSMVCSID